MWDDDPLFWFTSAHSLRLRRLGEDKTTSSVQSGIDGSAGGRSDIAFDFNTFRFAQRS